MVVMTVWCLCVLVLYRNISCCNFSQTSPFVSLERAKQFLASSYLPVNIDFFSPRPVLWTPNLFPVLWTLDLFPVLWTLNLSQVCMATPCIRVYVWCLYVCMHQCLRWDEHSNCGWLLPKIITRICDQFCVHVPAWNNGDCVVCFLFVVIRQTCHKYELLTAQFYCIPVWNDIYFENEAFVCLTCEKTFWSLLRCALFPGVNFSALKN